MSDDFYIGYRPMPETQKRFLKPRLWALMLAVPALAAAFSLHFLPLQASTWDDSPIVVQGWLYDAPVPLLQSDASASQSLLLVEQGKFGAEARLQAFKGRLPLHVSARGLLLHGAGKAMLELEAGPESLSESAASGLAPRMGDFVSGPLTLQGEIVDSKCYLGAMKPGFSKVHRECAMRCLLGGVPALFLTRDAQGGSELSLMMDGQGRALGANVAELAGLPVLLRAKIQEAGGWRILITDPEAIEVTARH